jgi:exonuclease VII small subunit
VCLSAQVLTKQYQRAIGAKVEAEEALLQAQKDVTQLIKLCEFCECSLDQCSICCVTKQC